MIEANNVFVVSAIKRGNYDWNTEVPMTIFTTREEADGQAKFLNGPYFRRGQPAQYEVKSLDDRINDIIHNAMAAAEYSDGDYEYRDGE